MTEKALMLTLVQVSVGAHALVDLTMARRILWQIRDRRHLLILLRQIRHGQIQQLRNGVALLTNHAELHCIDPRTLPLKPRQVTML